MRIEAWSGATFVAEDPYSFPGLLTDFDLHLLREGSHYRIWEKLGAHLVEIRKAKGVHFAVWAPNAQRVSVVGDFNGWDGRRHPMRKHEGNGIWELFVPGLKEGDKYKYELKLAGGGISLKTDPYAFAVELPPQTAACVHNLAGFEWGDEAWLEKRAKSNFLEEPMSVYEMHFGSWRRAEENRSLSYKEMATQLAEYLKETGFTHIELMPLTEHPFYGSWGYQTVNFFAPTARYGNPHELKYFIDAMHKAGIGVILDWVPAHFPSDAYGLANFDGTCLYEHSDPRKGKHPDWGTLVFNYGRTEVFNFLTSNALFWLKEYHFDGLRVDAVASMLYLDYSRKAGQWVPNKFGGKENLEAIEFLKHLNVLVHRETPGVVTIAEESTSWPGVSRPTYLGGLGFSLKWNMGWMHDVLEYFSKDPIYRKWHANKLTFSMLYQYTENFCLALSHDEVVHGKGSLIGKMPGDDWQKRAGLRALWAYMIGHPGKKLNFMGSEFGQYREWNHDSSLDWHLLQYDGNKGVLQFVKDLHALYKREPALWQQDFRPEGFRWIDCNDAESAVYSFIRFGHDPDEKLVFVCNFTPVPRANYRVGFPEDGLWEEVLNSDAAAYGGGNVGNSGSVQVENQSWQGQPCSAHLKIPPLGVVVFKKKREKKLEAPKPVAAVVEAPKAEPAPAAVAQESKPEPKPEPKKASAKVEEKAAAPAKAKNGGKKK
ncbi:MAG: 1,4-alpha-glucan branching protein GlgB [Myxococcales bacterium]